MWSDYDVSTGGRGGNSVRIPLVGGSRLGLLCAAMEPGHREMSTENGRMKFQWHHLVFLAGIVFTAGGSWWALQAQGQEIVSLKATTDIDHDSVIEMRQDLKGLRADIGGVQAEQQQQRQMLYTILSEVRRTRETP